MNVITCAGRFVKYRYKYTCTVLCKILETCRGLRLLSNRCNCRPRQFFVEGKLSLSLVHQLSLEVNLLSLYYQSVI